MRVYENKTFLFLEITDLIMLNHESCTIRPKLIKKVNGIDFLLTLNMRGQGRTNLQLLYNIPSLSLG